MSLRVQSPGPGSRERAALVTGEVERLSDD